MLTHVIHRSSITRFTTCSKPKGYGIFFQPSTAMIFMARYLYTAYKLIAKHVQCPGLLNNSILRVASFVEVSEYYVSTLTQIISPKSSPLVIGILNA